MARRVSQLDLNFDGLTDAVTNLAGTLILIALLLMGLTQAAVIPAAPNSVAPPDEQQAFEGPQKLDDLRQQIDQLLAGIHVSDQELEGLKKRLDELRARAEPLLQNTAG